MLAHALLAFLALPGLFAILLPVGLVAVDPWRRHGFLVGWAFAAAGLVVVIRCAWDFYLAGKGTLAPWDPPKHLVVRGLYRYVRNPMYVGVLALVGGTALLGGSPLTGAYVVLLAVGFHLRVVFSEEPWLAKHFPSEWEAYSAAVPRWVPGMKS